MGVDVELNIKAVSNKLELNVKKEIIIENPVRPAQTLNLDFHNFITNFSTVSESVYTGEKVGK